jgi:hypothetical protein
MTALAGVGAHGLGQDCYLLKGPDDGTLDRDAT